MLSRPKYGWTTVTIGDFSKSASYIRDVPNEVLDGMIHSYKTDNPFCVYFDAEGDDFTVVSDWYETSIIHNETLKQYEITRDDLAREIIEDIEADIEGWATWTLDENDSDRKKDVYRDLMMSKVNDLKCRLMEYGVAKKERCGNEIN